MGNLCGKHYMSLEVGPKCWKCHIEELEKQVDNWKIAATEQESAANSWRICHEAEVELHTRTRRLAQAVVDSSGNWLQEAEHVFYMRALAKHLEGE